VRPTRVRTLIVLAVLVGVLAWLFLHVMDNRGNTLPSLTWTAPAGVLALAMAVGVSWVTVRRRRDPAQSRLRPIDPLGMARMAVLGKAAAHVGAASLGFYLGWVVLLLPDLGIDSRRERALIAALAAVGALLLAVAGLLLERACRVRDDDEGPTPAPSGP
jgi:uncharacterized membrane protein YbhN (UPF0104 family)